MGTHLRGAYSVRTAPKSKKKPPTSSGDDAWCEGTDVGRRDRTAARARTAPPPTRPSCRIFDPSPRRRAAAQRSSARRSARRSNMKRTGPRPLQGGSFPTNTRFRTARRHRASRASSACPSRRAATPSPRACRPYFRRHSSGRPGARTRRRPCARGAAARPRSRRACRPVRAWEVRGRRGDGVLAAMAWGSWRPVALIRHRRVAKTWGRGRRRPWPWPFPRRTTPPPPHHFWRSATSSSAPPWP